MEKLTIILFCTWKFALTFPLAVYGMNMSFFDVLLYTNIGGLTGLLFFTYLWHFIIQWWNNKISPRVKLRKEKPCVFNKKNRRFIKVKNSYGFAGIVILNPVVLSIPISTFLVIKFYGRKKRYLAWLLLGQIVWSLIYAFFYIYT